MNAQLEHINNTSNKKYLADLNENSFTSINKEKNIDHSFSKHEDEFSANLTDLSKDKEKEFQINFLNDYDIFSLARHGRYVELESLFLNGIDPDSKDNFGNTILIIAAQNGNKRIAKMALRYGAQINMFNVMGNTALHFCNEYNYIDLADYLISKGANPNIKNLRELKASEGVRRKNNEKFSVKTSNFSLKSSKFDLNFMKNSKLVKESHSKEKSKFKKINII